MQTSQQSGALKYAQNLMEQLYSETPHLRNATGSTLVDQNQTSSMKVVPSKSSPYNKQKQGGTAKKPNFTIGQQFGQTLGTMSVTNEQWRARCTSMKENVENLKQENNKLETDIEKRQQRYIQREQQYRNTIQELGDQLNQLSGFDNSKAIHQFQEMEKTHQQILHHLDKVKKQTAVVLKHKENEIDLLQKQRKLKDLHQMTQLTEQIEQQNRRLIKRNSQLNIEFSSQDNDHTLLTHQLKMLKKQNFDLKKNLEQLQQLAAMKPPKGETFDEKSNNFSAKKQQKMRSNMSSAQSSKKGYSAKKGSVSSQASSRLQQQPPPKEQKYVQFENAIKRLKRQQKQLKKQQRYFKTMYSSQIQSKIQLEQLLRQCVDDVKAQISRKRSQNKVLYYMSLRAMQSPQSAQISKKDREKIIQVLLSQERVLTLLYDKTFPPKSHQTRIGGETQLPEGVYNIEFNQDLKEEQQQEGGEQNQQQQGQQQGSQYTFEQEIQKGQGNVIQTEEGNNNMFENSAFNDPKIQEVEQQ